MLFFEVVFLLFHWSCFPLLFHWSCLPLLFLLEVFPCPQREPSVDGETVENRIARVVGKVGPSMLLTSLSESLAFFLGKWHLLDLHLHKVDKTSTWVISQREIPLQTGLSCFCKDFKCTYCDESVNFSRCYDRHASCQNLLIVCCHGCHVWLPAADHHLCVFSDTRC